MIGVPLNEEQRYAVGRMHSFINSNESFFVLNGPAGTGKTSCVTALIAETSVNVALTAPTNKATKVLRDLGNKFPEGKAETATIYSILGLRLDKSGEEVRVAGTGSNRAGRYAVIVVDEGFMVSRKLMRYIREAALEFDSKFIFMGDPYQLPPVKESMSEVSLLPNPVFLTKVMRHDNQILSLATAIRTSIANSTPLPAIVSNYDDSGGVRRVNSKAFLRMALERFSTQEYLDDPWSTKIVAYRNDTVKWYNSCVRRVLYGREADEVPFTVGERVVVCQPIICELGDEIMMTTDDEAEVLGIKEEFHPIFRGLLVHRLTLLPDDSPELVTAYVLHESSTSAYEKLKATLAENANKSNRWGDYWRLIESIHDVRPAHAITAHRAQGSTFLTSMVDADDILSNRNKNEAVRCLYVAVTRASKLVGITK